MPNFSNMRLMQREQLLKGAVATTFPHYEIGEQVVDEKGNVYEYLRVKQDVAIALNDLLCQHILCPDTDYVAIAETMDISEKATMTLAKTTFDPAIKLSFTAVSSETAKTAVVVYEDLDGDEQTSSAITLPGATTTVETDLWCTKIISITISADTTGNISAGCAYSQFEGVCPVETMAADIDHFAASQDLAGAGNMVLTATTTLTTPQEITLTSAGTHAGAVTAIITYVDEWGVEKTSSAITWPATAITEGTGLYCLSISKVAISADTTDATSVGVAVRKLVSNCAIAMAAVTSNTTQYQYIWGLIKAKAGPTRVLASAGAGILLQVTTTPGVLDDAGGIPVQGITLGHAQKAAAGTHYLACIDFPYLAEPAA